jgi:6-phosphofructo-2-kinase
MVSASHSPTLPSRQPPTAPRCEQPAAACSYPSFADLLAISFAHGSTGSSTPLKNRATTLDIPGLTKSRVSPDGRIAQRDLGAKLVIVMVGLPARGKSYIVKKIARYLNWLQHPTEIFNVGNRRRIAASMGAMPTEKSIEGQLRESVRNMSMTTGALNGIIDQKEMLPPPALATRILVNGEPNQLQESPQETNGNSTLKSAPAPAPIDQSADFFDPDNKKAVRLREQVALETLDELLHYIMNRGGSIGILDATNSTLERRKAIMKHVRERAGPDLNVLFLESRCIDPQLLESNMRLKLSGPDYRDRTDLAAALADFKRRVQMYEKSYVPLGDYEEENNMPYVQMIDVGRKVVTHQIRGFLSIQAVTYLMNFNLAPRQIWLTRHGESLDNVNGRIGGDSDLSPAGVRYAEALTTFINSERALWEQRQREKQASTHFPPLPGDATPPNPEYTGQTQEAGERNFCVWTSMLKRSIQTAQYFNEDDFDIKQMRMLNELNAGEMEGMTYEQIRTEHNPEYELRKSDKLHYRYPGPGGEGYLDIINRLQKVIIEVERMTDHVLLVGHRSITRVLLAYFRGLAREDISDLDVPLGVLYMLEPVSESWAILKHNR